MDRQESNKKKAKNWLQRLLKIKNRFQERSTTSDVGVEEYIRRDMLENSDTRTHCNSFRRSLRKMHTRVKSCLYPQEITSQRPNSITEIPSSSGFPETPPPPPVPERPIVSEEPHFSVLHESTPVRKRAHRIPTDEIISLSNYYWYCGPMPTSEAEERLRYKPDGTFLVRDSSSTSYLFSISFRSVGKTMHARIEYNYNQKRYNLCGTCAEGFSSVIELIQDAMKTSENGIYCYSRKGEHPCEFPVRLITPISRYIEVSSLKHLCKFVIRQYTNMNDIPKLPLPTMLHSYLIEKPYF